MFLSQQHRDGVLTVSLTGRWLIENASALSAELDAIEPDRAREVLIDTRGLEDLDLTGAWFLHDWARGQRDARRGVKWQGEVPDQVRVIERTLENPPPQATTDEGIDFVAPVRRLGRWAIRHVQSLRRAVAFFGEICSVLGSALLHPRRLRFPALVRHINETGVQAIPIVSLIAFLISTIIAYLGAQELRRFGAEIFVIDLVTIGVLRELGVLLTAIIVAGRSGSAFAAEIGVMKLNEEVDALHAIGTSPVEVLVVPRLLGLVIALPLLTVIADGVGLTGGGLLCYFLFDIPPTQYLARVQESIAPTTFWVGVFKAPIFAFLIAFVGTLRGMQVRESSRELGRLTTVAVVQSIFLVIFADAVFAVLFRHLDI
ncbi:MAG TPA: MlaE family lipid ABC transporter permease subunit [Steroidobacteraceae bacterium]|nr:MlaE family lipid ABC transporter permease subunit [Steroidobacteraceae bacterium]